MRIFSLIVLCGCLSSCYFLQSPETEFWGRLTALCGKSYAGELLTSDEQDAAFRDRELSISVSSCKQKKVVVDFFNSGEAVGHWELTKHRNQIELRHIHEGAALTGYGGFSTDNSSGLRMNFPADDTTKDLFDAEGIPVSKQNIWAINIYPGSYFQYELTRPGREFIVEFHTNNPLKPDAEVTH